MPTIGDQVSARKEHRELLIWCFAFAAVALWPLFVFEFPANQDVPNHLARIFVLLNWDDPAIAQHFAVTWNPLPNLAWDIFGVTLGRVMPLVWVLKLYMVICFGLTMVGVFALNRTRVGHWSWMALLAVPFTFHAGFIKGFLSFNLGFGLALVACAVWVSQTETRWLKRLLVGTLFSVLLFYTHLVAWGIYGVFVLGYGLEELRSALFKNGPKEIMPWLGRMARDGLQAVPPFIMMAGATLYVGSGVEFVGDIVGFDSFAQRIESARHVVDTGGQLPSLIFLAIVGIYPFYLLFIRKVLVYSPSFSIAIALLVLLFLVMPNQIYATHYIVWRVVSAAIFIAIASGIPKQSIRAPLTRFSLTLFLVVTLGLSGWHAYSTYNSEVERKNFLGVIERIPEGQTLFMTHSGIGPGEIEYDRIGVFHIGSYAVLERKVMVQSLFALPTQQPIGYSEPEFGDLLTSGEVFISIFKDKMRKRGRSVEEHLRNFQWVVVHGPSPQTDLEEIPLSDFTLTASQGHFRLYCNVESASAGASQCPDGQAP